MSQHTKVVAWWCAVALMVLAAALAPAMLRQTPGGLATLSEVAYLERVEGTYAAGKAPIEKNELSPLSRWLVSQVTAKGEEAQRMTLVLNGAACGLLMLLFLVAVSRWLPWWLTLASGGAWLCAPVVVGQMTMGTPGMVSLLFLLGPAIGLTLALSRGHLWVRLACVGVAGIAAGAGVFAHPLALWVSLSLLLTLFAAFRRKHDGEAGGLLELPPLGGEMLTLLGGLLAGFVVTKMLLRMNGGDLLAYLFGFLEGPHPPFGFLGEMYRGGEMGGPPWYAPAWLFLVRQPLPVVATGLLGAGFLWATARKGDPELSGGWPFWGATLVIAMSASLMGSPVVPAGLNLLVVFSPAWAALAAWGLLQMWTRFSPEARCWWYAGRVVLVLAALGMPIGGCLAALSAHPIPSAYASFLGLGTKYFLAQGNDPVGELAVPKPVLQALVETKQREMVGHPDAKGLSRLVGLLPGEPKLKIREGGPFPLFRVFAPASPRMDLLPAWPDTQDSGWTVDVADWPVYGYRP